MNSIIKQDFKSIYSLQEFINASPGMTSIGTDTLTDNTFYWNNGTVHCKTVAGTFGGFMKTFADLSAGDVVELEFEYRLVSGVAPKFSIDETDKIGNTGYLGSTIITRSTKGKTEWETVKVKCIFLKNTYNHLRVSLGLYTADIGEYYIRNIRIVVNRKVEKNKTPRVIGTNPYSFKKVSGVWTINTGVSYEEGAVLSTLDSQTLFLTFTKPYLKAPVAIATCEYTNGGDKYKVKPAYSTTTTIAFKIYNSSDTLMTLSAIEDNVCIDVIVSGWYE